MHGLVVAAVRGVLKTIGSNRQANCMDVNFGIERLLKQEIRLDAIASRNEKDKEDMSNIYTVYIEKNMKKAFSHQGGLLVLRVASRVLCWGAEGRASKRHCLLRQFRYPLASAGMKNEFWMLSPLSTRNTQKYKA